MCKLVLRKQGVRREISYAMDENKMLNSILFPLFSFMKYWKSDIQIVKRNYRNKTFNNKEGLVHSSFYFKNEACKTYMEDFKFLKRRWKKKEKIRDTGKEILSPKVAEKSFKERKINWLKYFRKFMQIINQRDHV